MRIFFRGLNEWKLTKVRMRRNLAILLEVASYHIAIVMAASKCNPCCCQLFWVVKLSVRKRKTWPLNIWRRPVIHHKYLHTYQAITHKGYGNWKYKVKENACMYLLLFMVFFLALLWRKNPFSIVSSNLLFFFSTSSEYIYLGKVFFQVGKLHPLLGSSAL